MVARIHVIDQNGANLSGTTVSFTVKKPNGSPPCTLTATADAGGTAESSCAIPSGPNGTWSVHIENVTKAGYTYDAAGSVIDHNFTVQ